MGTGHRIQFIDVLKGFAIFLVLWGHVIYRSSPVFAFIYSFHMPLFFLISGFFFQSTLRLSPREFLYKKGMQLFYPWLLWCVLLGIYHFIHLRLYEVNFLQAGILLFNRYFWFLKSLFLSYVIVYFACRLFKKTVWAVAVSIVFVIVCPFLHVQSFYLPFFLLGIVLKNHYSFFVPHVNKVLGISLTVFFVCLCFWKSDYIGMSPSLFSAKSFSYVMPDIPPVLLGWTIGVAGALFFFFFFQKYYRENAVTTYLKKAGRNTLGIYILQVILVEIFMPAVLHLPPVNSWIFSLLIAPLLSWIALEVCLRTIRLIEKNKKLSIFLFGSKTIF